MVWPGDTPAGMVRFIGLSELLGAVGLVLPAALRVAPILTPLAAAGLATVMIFAAVFHGVRGDGMQPIVMNLVLATIALLVAWGRFKVAPIAPRS